MVTPVRVAIASLTRESHHSFAQNLSTRARLHVQNGVGVSNGCDRCQRSSVSILTLTLHQGFAINNHETIHTSYNEVTNVI
jgi:hypothetical protein